MLVVATDAHRAHHVNELDGGQLIPSWESPSRADHVVAAMRAAGAEILEPEPVDHTVLARLHDPGYLEFLGSAWDRWVAAGRTAPAAMAFNFPVRRFDQDVIPDHIDAQLGYYSFALDCSIGPHTHAAALASASVAQGAARLVADGNRAAFAVCRPPGHHATRDQFGGYCFLNNAGVAAEVLRAGGATRVGILDVDYHHGNGTQDIFYERGDVVVSSLHCDPHQQFPWFIGYATETGRGEGAGANHNFPLPRGTDAGTWFATLERAIAALDGVDALVVSLGLDTFEGDPISDFGLTSAHYPVLGRRIEAMGLPTVLVLEGGYATAELGTNAQAVVAGFDGALSS